MKRGNMVVAVRKKGIVPGLAEIILFYYFFCLWRRVCAGLFPCIWFNQTHIYLNTFPSSS